MSEIIIAPSMLAADFGNLQRDVELINNSEADWFHIDVMDGVFVPNISYGFPVIEAIKKHATKPLDVHLMIVNPDQYISQFVDCGAAVISVHLEACTHIHRTLQHIKSFGIKAGLAINPGTSLSVIEDILEEIDLVLLMSVNPGFGGQKFIQHTYNKTLALKEMLYKKNLNPIIEIDGGVNLETGAELIKNGANALVAGSFVFNSVNPKEVISNLKAL